MTPPDRIEDMDRQLQELKQRNRKSEQVLRIRNRRLRNAVDAKQRKLNTRRNILIGNAVLLDAQHDPQLREWLLVHFINQLKNERDRKLFDNFSLRFSDSPEPRRSFKSQLLHWFQRLTTRTKSLLRTWELPS